MALVKVKPTSPGRRGVVKVVNRDLHKGRPVQALLEKKSKSAGRNNAGRITMRHKGGGHKKLYRIVDFKRRKFDVEGVVERLEYDPNRTAFLALVGKCLPARVEGAAERPPVTIVVKRPW